MKRDKKKGAVAKVFSPEALLKRRIRAHFKKLGFAKADDGSLIRPSTEKNDVRRLHSGQRAERLFSGESFLVRALPRTLPHFADGNEIDPAKIKLRLVRVYSDTREADLFRVATLTWSVPVSPGFGRRLRYLVWDKHHERLVGVIALGDPVYNLSVRDNLIGVASRIVLGTDFRTDIALFSLPFDAPFRVRPGNDETATALRTVCEAVAKAACRLLEIESSEILAEYRAALTERGAAGLEAEIFIYDTLAGGAGFSPQLVRHGTSLFNDALAILASCPANCDASCYRCIRSFRNKLDHRLLDRHLGTQLLRHALQGGYPDYPVARVNVSMGVLFDDLTRQLGDSFEFRRDVARVVDGQSVTIPILVTRRSSGAETWLALNSPIAPGVPVHRDLRELRDRATPIVCVDDLVVRRHLPQAVQTVADSAR
jgi:Domain of unknown function (DUF4338)/Domain of unknown function (DUF1998)